MPFLRPKETEVLPGEEDVHLNEEQAEEAEMKQEYEAAGFTDDSKSLEYEAEEEIQDAEGHDPGANWLRQHQWQLTNWAAVVCIPICFWFNLSTIPGFHYAMPEPMKNLAFVTGMEQGWDGTCSYPIRS